MLSTTEYLRPQPFAARADARLARNPGDSAQAEAGAVLRHSRALAHRRCSSGPQFLRRLTPHIASATNWWNAANTWLEIGISYAGLEALGVPQDSLQSFPEAFRVGMAARARQLGDDGNNDPKNWDKPYRKSRSIWGERIQRFRGKASASPRHRP